MSTKSPKPTFPRTGVAYIAAIEHEFFTANKLTVCNRCLAMGFDKALKRCNGCMLVDYCGKDCQKGDWKRHRGFCNMVQGRGRRAGYLEGLVGGGDGGLMGGRELVYRVVVDAYRLRMEMDEKVRGEGHGLYSRNGGSEEGKGGLEGLVWVDGGVESDFQKWLDLCEEAGVLPDWWAEGDGRLMVMGVAVDRGNGVDGSVYRHIDQEGLMERYGGDTAIRNALCVLAELVVGYDGKGRALDDEWYMNFSEFLDLHPAERARLIQGTVDAVRGVKELQEKESKEAGHGAEEAVTAA